MLKEESIENFSGTTPALKRLVPPLKDGEWLELDFTPGGDAPKSFIALYEYERDGNVKKSNPKSWHEVVPDRIYQ